MSGGGTAFVTFEGLGKRYGSRWPLRGVTGELAAGEITGLLGPNGAGKSTFIRVLLGLIRPTEGSVSIGGAPLRWNDPAIRRRTGAIVEAPAFDDFRSAWENLRTAARLSGDDPGPERCREVLGWAGLAERADDPVRVFSTGMRQRLALAAAIAHRPAWVVLDEPTSGLDPEALRDVHGLIRALHSEYKTTILLSSHNLAEVDALCSRLLVLSEGQVRYAGTVAGFRARVGGAAGCVHGESADVLRAVAAEAGIADPVIEATGAQWILMAPAGTDPALLSRAAGLRPGVVALEWREPPLERAFLHG